MSTFTPVILESNLLEFDEKLLKIQEICNRVQVDIIDGLFVENKTVLPADWPLIKENLIIDAHFMVLEPERPIWVEQIKIQKIDLVIGQFEGIRNIDEFFGQVGKLGRKIGLALDIDTPVEVIKKEMLEHLDAIILMSIKTGYSGQEFDGRVIPKIKTLRENIGNTAEIIIDGGVDLETGRACLEAGADVLSSNSFFWQNPIENYQKFSQLCNSVKGTI